MIPHRLFPCLLPAAACFLFLSAIARAQEEESFTPRRPYVEIPFEGDLDRALAGKLLKTLLEQMGKNPAVQLPHDLNLNQPFDQRKIEKLLEQLPEGKEKEVLENLLQKGRAESRDDRPDKTAPSSAPAPVPAGAGPAPGPPTSPTPPPPPARDDALARWTRELLDQARESEYGDMVMKSPALRQGIEELHKFSAKGDASQSRFAPPPQLARWMERLRPSNLASLPRLGWMKPQALWQSQPKVRLPTMDIAPAVPRLALGLPRWGGSGPSGGNLSHGVFWVALLALGTLLCWHVLRRWSGAGSRRGTGLRQLGPWPVNPGNVSTSEELILAFEYLSLLRLGPDARSWNHRTIAVQLGTRNADERWRLAANELASLYERARYAPAADPLPAEALASARRGLCLLSGVTSA